MQWCDVQSLDMKGMLIDFYAGHLRYARIFFIAEDVRIFSLELINYLPFAKDRHIFLLHEVEGADVIQSGCVIFVLMGKDNRIESVDPGSKHLHAKVRPSVDDK